MASTIFTRSEEPEMIIAISMFYSHQTVVRKKKVTSQRFSTEGIDKLEGDKDYAPDMIKVLALGNRKKKRTG